MLKKDQSQQQQEKQYKVNLTRMKILLKHSTHIKINIFQHANCLLTHIINVNL